MRAPGPPKITLCLRSSESDKHKWALLMLLHKDPLTSRSAMSFLTKSGENCNNAHLSPIYASWSSGLALKILISESICGKIWITLFNAPFPKIVSSPTLEIEESRPIPSPAFYLVESNHPMLQCSPHKVLVQIGFFMHHLQCKALVAEKS